VSVNLQFLDGVVPIDLGDDDVARYSLTGGLNNRNVAAEDEGIRPQRPAA